MKRLLALVAAGAMIVSAVVLRGWLDDRDGGGGSSSDGDGSAVLACDTTLREVCESLDLDDVEIVVEDAATTRGRLEPASADPDTVGIDGWLTFDPIPTGVSEARERAGILPILGDPSEPIARSPLTLVGWSERLEVLRADCEQLDWRCIGDRAGDDWDSVGGAAAWGRVEPGIDDIDTDAIGLLVGGQAATAYFDDPAFASNDFDGAFRAWWSDLLDAIPASPSTRTTVLDQMLAAGPASYDVVGATEARAVPTVSGSREDDRVTISYPSPVTTADVVFVPVLDAPHGDDLTDLPTDDDLARALLAAGWRVEGEPLPEGADADVVLPDGNNLPRAGVLEALRRL